MCVSFSYLHFSLLSKTQADEPMRDTVGWPTDTWPCPRCEQGHCVRKLFGCGLTRDKNVEINTLCKFLRILLKNKNSGGSPLTGEIPP